MTVAGQQGPFSTATTNYRVPSITGITGAVDMATAGSERVTLSGDDFGAQGSGASVVCGYSTANGGYAYSAACTVTASHSTAECTTSPGVGAGHRWTLTIGICLLRCCTLATLLSL